MSPNNGKSAIHETDESAETKPTFRLTSLPPEIISLIFSFTKEHPQQHIYRYIQVSKFFYTELIGTLYGRLNLNKDNVQKIFHNILLTTQGEFDNGTDTTIEYDSDPDSADGSDFSIQQHTGAEDRSHPDAKDKGSQDFLLDIKASNSIHRKLVLLSIVDHLILEDWQAGKAVAKMIKLKSQDTLKPFCNVTTLSIGLDFLRPNGTLPSPNTSAWDEMTSVLMILAKLQLKHCCANWHALRYYDEEDIYFSILINIWMTQYKLETMTWHGMVQSHHPIPLFGLSNSFLTRHFFKDFERRDQNQIGPSQEQMASQKGEYALIGQLEQSEFYQATQNRRFGQTSSSNTVHCFTYIVYTDHSKIEVKKENIGKVFYGLDYTVEDEDEWHEVKNNHSKSYDQALKSHNRKIDALNFVKSLIIDDFAGAEAIAKSLNQRFAEYIDSESYNFVKHEHFYVKVEVPEAPSMILKNVENICLGRGLLQSHEVYPFCAHDGEPEPHPIVSILSKGLNCKDVCYDYRAASKHHDDDDGFIYAISLLVRYWKFNSATFHHMNQYPHPAHHTRPNVKIFLTDIKPKANTLDKLQKDGALLHFVAYHIDLFYWCCVHPREDEKTRFEIAYPGFDILNNDITPEKIIETGKELYRSLFWHQTCGKDSYEDCMEATDKRWQERLESGWFEKFLKIDNLENVEPCVCCGKK
ncbi:uncharacterized protein L201_001512 [Kwoniella dendrophila CBS 6074]|uniref:F-box domain-containing protein n=1 Tax=Kwoniella dendrophila CBS 6074 TaxID=1295534 RepID=A0AAX4JMI5_9TREE